MKYPSQSTSCKHVGVAHSDIGDVAICPDCGVVHVSLQYVSMRFAPEAFRSLAHMLGVAQDRIDSFGHALQARSEDLDSAHIDARSMDKIH